jgi:hypothetical protein
LIVVPKSNPIEKIDHDLAFDRKIHILWNIASQLCRLQCIQLGLDHADNVSRSVREWSFTVAWLHWRGNLQ